MKLHLEPHPGYVGIDNLMAGDAVLDQIEVGEHRAVVRKAVLLDHLRDELVGLVIVPTAFAHETVVDQYLLVREFATVRLAPVEHFSVRLAGQHLRLYVLVAHAQVAARPAIESLSEHVEVVLRQLCFRMKPDLRAHPREIKQSACLLEAAFESLNFHGR